MPTYRFDVLSISPPAFDSCNKSGVIGRAFLSDIAELHIHNPRNFSIDKHKKVDDEPYGGGAGMVIKPEPFFSAFEAIPVSKRRRVLIMSPQGKTLSQSDLKRWSLENDQLVLICGQYEGFDERIRMLADEEISLGDFVLTGGELPAMAIINGVVRLLPGTLGASESLLEESHTDLLLEHPHYTRPANFRGMKVPEILLSGDHEAIFRWRNNHKKERTRRRRPDLYKQWLAKKASLGSRIDPDLLSVGSVQLRIGNGYDMHRLVKDRDLILGGVNLSHPDGLGLDGHSDADVLTHAVMDALLGALSLGDIGKYFPPDDPKWKGADSLKLLEAVMNLISEQGWKVVNVDSVIVAERPKMKPFIELMRKNIAERIGVSIQQIGVKATTNEKLGAEGREEGISSHAVVLLELI
tara:strand:+ start:7733 stop:8962 length:1230 start_codon:yes stop_codon:yes gene_type:complete